MRNQPWGAAGSDNDQDLLLNLPPEGDTALDFGKYISAIRRHWLLPVVCVLITVSYALVRYTLTTKEYRANSTIQIERKRLSVMALGGQGGWLEDWWNLEYYPTQYRLLRSRGMAERVVKNLRLYENPHFTGRPVGSSQASETATSDTELARLASRVQSGLTVSPIKSTQLVELSYVSVNPEIAAQLANGYAEAFIEWGIETRSDTVVQASTFLSRQIETLREEIEERQRDLNKLISESDFALDPAGEALLERRQVLEQQYNAVMVERLQNEAAYQEIQTLPGEIVAKRSSPDTVNRLKTEIFTLESEYESKLDVYRPEWPEMKRLQEQLDEKREHLRRAIEEAFEQEKAQAYAEYQQARLEEDALEQQLKKLAADARLQNSAALDYTNQITYINTRKELLNELVKRQSETEVASRVQEGTQGSNIRIVDHAIIPSTAFRPTLRKSLVTAIMLGLALGLSGIVLLEFLDRTIKSPEELESLLGYPTLTVIPDLSEKGRGAGLRYRYGKSGYGYSYSYGYGYGYGTSPRPAPAKAWKRAKKKGADKSGEPTDIELLPFHNPRLAICEAYRSLRTALLLSSAEELKVVAVTSAEPSEGKTVTVSNLGVVMAQLDRRVLIIDADLRRPRQHKVFKLTNRLGLVNYLTSRVELDSIVRATEVPNLYVCTAGPIPPNPSELLASDRLRELAETVRARFDFVLFDSPPVLPVADAVILGSLVDGLVICARAGVLLREDAKHCGERLRYAGLRIFGTVLNRYRSTAASPYSRRYQYYGPSEETSSSTPADSAA